MADKPFRSQLSKAEQELSEIFDGTHLVGFRNDIESIWTENRAEESWNIDSTLICRSQYLGFSRTTGLC
ncbi:hypothetical protein GCM10009037_24670 [Halarchaeum grantii]|uniref:Uncharacterized protein n=1 Tax=Halarchaeum grantii TaxID=1193105 RepID=A0A830F543_9EURY|nr:hypothetical protein GCM10009037_24670 [Halarchaeum grantii]